MLLKCFGIYTTEDSLRAARKGAVISSFVPIVMLITFLDGFEAFVEEFAVISRALEEVGSMKSSKFSR